MKHITSVTKPAPAALPVNGILAKWLAREPGFAPFGNVKGDWLFGRVRVM